MSYNWLADRWENSYHQLKSEFKSAKKKLQKARALRFQQETRASKAEAVITSIVARAADTRLNEMTALDLFDILRQHDAVGYARKNEKTKPKVGPTAD